jgi:hypothetical protein
MRKCYYLSIPMIWMSCALFAAKEEPPQAIMFSPPKNWQYVSADQLSEKVKVMVVGKSRKGYPPSINLGVEEYKGTLKDYLKLVKRINDEHGGEWKDLGMIRTPAGNASLSQLDTRTEWGWVRMMHVILVKDGAVYILTTASLRDEFASNYNDFFNTMRSLSFGPLPEDQSQIANITRSRHETVR